MQNNLKFYINGEWIEPAEPAIIDVINPATEQPFTQISAGSSVDIDRAVAAARAAFDGYSQWSVEQRIELLERIRTVYKTRFEDIAQAISTEMGAPIDMSRSSQTVIGMGHIKNAINILKDFEFETLLLRLLWLSQFRLESSIQRFGDLCLKVNRYFFCFC